MTKITLMECEELAKKDGFDRATFDPCGPAGRFKAKWLDAYFGFFTVEGQHGFITVKQAQEYGLWAENFAGANAKSTSTANNDGGAMGEGGRHA